MSLQCYMNEFSIPEDCEIVTDNRKFFVDVTIDKLDNRVDNLLRNTDKAKYKDDIMFTDRFGYNVPWRCLSTGGMTILNIFYNPDKIFRTDECGLNAVEDILLLNQGSVYDMGFLSSLSENDVDIYVHNGDNSRHYSHYDEIEEDYT